MRHSQMKTSTESVKDATKSDGPLTITGKTNFLNVREILESDDRYAIRDIAKAVCILLSLQHFIFKRNFESTINFCYMDSHISTDDQQRYKYSHLIQRNRERIGFVIQGSLILSSSQAKFLRNNLSRTLSHWSLIHKSCGKGQMGRTPK